jgi:soluble lytic murein transglycosylase-like protein
MKISVFIAAAVAAGAMTIASHAKDTSEIEQPAQANVETQAGGGFGDLMKQVLRAGNAAARVNGGTAPMAQAAKEAEVASLDPTVTASTNAARKAQKAQAQEAQSGGRPYHSIVSRYASQYGVPVSLAHAVIRIESNYRPKAKGRAGEIGLMQIKPSTARAMGHQGSASDLFNPEVNIKYGMKYLGQAYKLGGGDTCSAILKYNAGHGAKRMNPTSSAYCQKVKRLIGGA